jgi:hypothetical protein
MVSTETKPFLYNFSFWHVPLSNVCIHISICSTWLKHETYLRRIKTDSEIRTQCLAEGHEEHEQRSPERQDFLKENGEAG